MIWFWIAWIALALPVIIGGLIYGVRDFFRD